MYTREGKLQARTAHDLTAGNLYRHVTRLATPTTVEMALYAMTGLLHAYWMGKVGPLALAAVTMGTSLRTVLISPMMGLSAGGMAVVANEIGAGNRRAADHACAQTLVLVMVVALPLIAIGQILAPTLLGWMGATGEVLSGGIRYLRIILWGLFFMECLPTMNGVIRGAGRPEFTLRVALISRAVFFVLEPLLAIGWGPIPGLGVQGVALAEMLGNVAGVGAQAVMLLSRDGCLTLRLRDLVPHWPTLSRIVRIALPNAVQRLSPNLASALFLRLVAGLGNTVLAGYSVFSQLQTFVLSPVQGLQSAAATMVGQNLGSGQRQRASRSAWFAAALGAALPVALYALLNLAGARLLVLFNSDAQTIAAARQVLFYALIFGAFNGLWLVLGNALAGAGDAFTPTIISLVSLWAVQLPACWLLAGSGNLGATGIWLGMIIGNLACASGMAWRFNAGRWQFIGV